jgi:hypothetical protein
MGADLDSKVFEDALAEGQKMLAEESHEHELDGIEIWQGPNLLYKSEAASS